jgi:hypothetical protein
MAASKPTSPVTGGVYDRQLVLWSMSAGISWPTILDWGAAVVGVGIVVGAATVVEGAVVVDGVVVDGVVVAGTVVSVVDGGTVEVVDVDAATVLLLENGGRWAPAAAPK